MMNTNELAKKLHDLKGLKVMLEELQTEITAIEDEVKQTMIEENKDTLLIDCFKVSYKSVVSNRIDTTALKKELPEIAERYTKQTSSRRFTIT